MFAMNQPIELFATKTELEAYRVVALIDKIRVGHPLFEAALDGINECLKASVFAREPVNCMLLGEGGMGKTSLAEMVKASMKPETIRENDMETRTVPAFYASFKSATSINALLSDMLLKLGDPYPMLGKVDDKAVRFYKALIQCRTKIIFLDELHDIEGFSRNNHAAMKKFFKVLKAITNERGPVTCLMGIPECHDIFKGDGEMSRRFKRQVILRRLSPGTEANPGLLQNFLSDIYDEIVRSTPIKSLPNVTYVSALQIYAATGGSPDYIMTLIKESVVTAMLNNRVHVEVGDYAKAWADGNLNGADLGKKIRLTFNPFLASQAQIASVFREGLW